MNQKILLENLKCPFFTIPCVKKNGRNTIKNGKFCDLQEPALQISVASREKAEGEDIVNNTFTYKVSQLLESEFEPPQARAAPIGRA